MARLWRQRSKLGLWLDPLADKLLMTSAFVLLSLPAVSRPNAIPVWVVGIVIGRDVLIALAASSSPCVEGKKFYPSMMGKVSTVAQVLTVLLVLFFNCLGTSPFVLSWMYQATVAGRTVLSGGHYAWLAWGREQS